MNLKQEITSLNLFLNYHIVHGLFLLRMKMLKKVQNQENLMLHF